MHGSELQTPPQQWNIGFWKKTYILSKLKIWICFNKKMDVKEFESQTILDTEALIQL